MVLLDGWTFVIQSEKDVIMGVNDLCMGFAAIFGFIGGFRIYRNWQLNHHFHIQVTGEIARWFLGAIFFLVAHAAICTVWGWSFLI